MAGNSALQEAVVARNLVKKYYHKEVVKNISFTVKRGECFGILGPNGAGKTTIIKMIYGLSPVTSGELKVFGMDVKRNQREIKKLLGVVSQENTLDPDLTVWENMKIFARYYGLQPARVQPHLKRLLRLMGLSERDRSKVEELSGGMKRRLAIARGLINSPSLLILDEPTTGLDPHARQIVWQQLHNIKEEKKITILLTTHYLEEATRLCDKMVIMDDGLILEEGYPISLVEKHVGQEVLELWLNKQPAQWVNRIAHRFKHLLKGHWVFGNTVHLYTVNGKKLLQGIHEMSLPCRHHHLRPSTLEDVFLKLTGKELKAE